MVTLVLLSSLSSWLKVKSVVSVDWTEAVRLSAGPSPDTLILEQKQKVRESIELVQDCAVRGNLHRWNVATSSIGGMVWLHISQLSGQEKECLSFFTGITTCHRAF
jgi:hypothetical protein